VKYFHRSWRRSAAGGGIFMRFSFHHSKLSTGECTFPELWNCTPALVPKQKRTDLFPIDNMSDRTSIV
jgi:hypothetical protein